MPIIGIIVPVYNVETKICRCIDSILSQSFTDFELVLVNDGSIDKSGDICNEYAKNDRRIKVIHQVNRGVSAARNTGIRETMCEYISFVDSDDYIEPDYLRTLYNGIQNCQLSICGVFYCSNNSDIKTCQRIYEDNTVRLIPECSEQIAEYFKSGRFNYVYSKMYCKSIIDNNNICFDESVTLGEDTIFVLEYLKHIEVFRIIGEPLYNYVKYDKGTLTTSFSKESFKRYIFVIEKLEEGFRAKNLLSDHLQKSIDNRCFEAIGWTIDSVFINSSLKKSEIIDVLEQVCCNKTVKESIERNTIIVNSNKLLSVVRAQSPQRLYRVCVYKMIHDRIKRLFKIIVVKVFPNSIIRKVKEWSWIVQ